MDEAGDVTIRVADPRADANLMSQVDTSFETDTVFEVHADDYGFRLATRLADEPIRKVFPLDDISGDHRWEHAWLAMDSATAVGFIAAQYESWNSRAVIWHFYVNPTHRKRGIGRRLLDACLAEARVEGMKTAWLETSNLNFPGVVAYLHLGFALCGLDLSLYDGTAAEGEVALFLRRSLNE